MKKRHTIRKPVKVSIDVSLESYDDVIEAIYRDADQLMKEYAPRALCKKGCSSCCSIPVGTHYLEAAYLTKFMNNNLPVKTRLSIGRQMEGLRNRYHREITSKFMVALPKKDDFTDIGQIDSLNMVFDLQQFPMTCPLLINGQCSAYDARPLSCRVYLSESREDCRESQATPLMNEAHYSETIESLQKRLLQPSMDLSSEVSIELGSRHELAYYPELFFRLIWITKDGEMALIGFNSFKESKWLRIK